MSEKHKKQFAVWMDSHHATIAGRKNVDTGDFTILGHVKNEGASGNSNENAAHHQEITKTLQFFKEIVSKIQNVDEIHVTGTGQIQEQFIKFLADTPQYKHAHSSESTSIKMSDEQLLSFVTKHFN